MRILGIDPGDHTGLAVVNFSENSGPTVSFHREVMHNDPAFASIMLDLARDMTSLIAIEEFAIHGNTKVFRGNKLLVVQVIGRVKHIAEELGIPVVMVRPVDRRFFDQDKLTMLGLPRTYGSNHARDAVYIALYAGYFSKGGPKRKFGSDAVRRLGEAKVGSV